MAPSRQPGLTLMRLLLATAEYTPHAAGGIARYYETLTAALARNGWDVTVVVASPFSDGFDSYEHDGVHVHSVSTSDVNRRSADMPQLSAVPVFRRAIAAARAAHELAGTLGPFDVIETTDFALQFVPFVLDESSARVVVQCHGSMGQVADHEPRRADVELDQALARLTESTLLALADDVQTYAAPNAREWSDRLGRHVRVALPPFDGGSEEEAWHPSGPALVVGRIQPWKGPEVLCRAWRLLPEKSRARVLWAGRDTPAAPDGGSYDAWLRRHYADVWGPVIEPIGQKASEEIRHLQRRARLVIVPSEWDVFNFTTVEAMSSGALVLCSDGAGARGLVEHGRTGFVFRAGDAEGLARILHEALTLSPAEASAMGRNARAEIAARLDPDAIARERIGIYTDLIGAPPRKRAPDWVRGFFQGAPSARVGLAFLDQIPIRDLSRYLGERVGKRVGRRVAAAREGVTS